MSQKLLWKYFFVWKSYLAQIKVVIWYIFITGIHVKYARAVRMDWWRDSLFPQFNWRKRHYHYFWWKTATEGYNNPGSGKKMATRSRGIFFAANGKCWNSVTWQRSGTFHVVVLGGKWGRSLYFQCNGSHTGSEAQCYLIWFYFIWLICTFLEFFRSNSSLKHSIENILEIEI